MITLLLPCCFQIETTEAKVDKIKVEKCKPYMVNKLDLTEIYIIYSVFIKEYVCYKLNIISN